MAAIARRQCRPAVPIRSCSRRGLPCRPRCRGRGALLPHPFTLARAGPRAGASAVCVLWHLPWGCPRRALPGTVFPWSPDFPPPEPKPRRQPSGRLARRSIVRNGAIGKARRTGLSIQALAHPVAPGFLGAVEALVGGFDQIFKAGDTGIFGAGGADAYCHMGRRLGGRVGDL